MEQKFNNNPLDLHTLREFREREGEEIAYRKGDQLEREGDPARWSAFVTERGFRLYPLLIICLAWLISFSLSSLGGSSPPKNLGVFQAEVLA